MFVDRVKIHVKGGDGGDGKVSFYRAKYITHGGPDGGDGGKGGNVVFVGESGMSTLMDFRYKRKFVATPGEPGGKRNCFGKDGEDIIIKVPVGTVIREAESGKVMADITTAGEEKILIHGGKGGKGNQHFATPTRQAPRYAEPGRKSKEYDVILELKLIADVGLIGFPNVGKSTLLSMVTNANPKIANYHFTTITPVLGVVTVGEKSFVMADIPGLIEGASEGIGLGHSFLRHVERCRLIVHVVDVSGIEGRDPEDDFEKINYELKNFSEEISERPQIVVMNKCDLASEEQIAKFRKYIEDKGLPCFECSAATTKGTAQVIEYIAGELDKLPPPIRFEAQPLTARELDEQELKKKEFTITKQDGIYIVDAPFMVPVLSMVNMEDYESLQYFQRVLRFSGIIDKLEEMGVQEDDTVSIYDFEFRYLR